MNPKRGPTRRGDLWPPSQTVQGLVADYPDVTTTGPSLDSASETWGDPFAVHDPDGDGWPLLVTARAAVVGRNDDGVVAHLHSSDLETCTVLPPFSPGGRGFGQLEVL